MIKRINLFAIPLIYLIAMPANSNTIIVKEGDTLHGIAKKNNISLRQLMEINEIYNASKIKIGQEIILPQKKELKNLTNRNNSLSNSDKKDTITNYSEKKVDFHKVEKGDSLSKISRLYNISIDDIVNINKLKDPEKLNVGTILYLSNKSMNRELDKPNNKKLESKSKIIYTEQEVKVDWREYGFLKINWGELVYREGNFIAPSLNKNNEPLFIALNCSRKKINTTKRNGEWRSWFSPKEEFEYQLLNDICKN